MKVSRSGSLAWIAGAAAFAAACGQLTGCGDDAQSGADGGPDGAPGVIVDAAGLADRSTGQDARTSDSSAADTSTAADTGRPDTSTADTSVADTSTADTSAADTSTADTNAPDTSVSDAGADTSVADAGVADSGAGVADSGAGVADSGVADAGADTSVLDAGVADSGAVDSAVSDAGAADTGALDASAFDAADAASALAVGLVRYYPFSGNANDMSTSAQNALVFNATLTADRFGNASAAYAFNGTNASVEGPASGMPIGATDRTLTAWIRPTTAPPGNVGAVIHWGSGDCTAKMFGFGRVPQSSVPRLFVWGGCSDYQSTTLDLLAGTWTFVAMRFTAPRTVKAWVRAMPGDAGSDAGVAFEETVLPVALATTAGRLWIGGEVLNNDGNFRSRFTGDIDEVRVWSRALTDAEIDAVYALP